MRVTITLAIGVSQLIKDDSISFTVRGVTNHNSKKPSDSFQIFSTTGIDIQLIHARTSGLSITNANLGTIYSMTGIPLLNYLEVTTTWIFSFTMANQVPNNGKVRITFPSGFTLNS